jgi:hypothetical protein
MDRFMLGEITRPNLRPIAWQVNGGDVNTASLTELKRTALSVGTDGLCGCTTLVVISRRSIYATHWWESISFAPDDQWRATKGETNREVFRRTVLNGLEEGVKVPHRQGEEIVQWPLNNDEIDDNTIRAYLVRPKTRCPSAKEPNKTPRTGYTWQWDAIRQTVEKRVPRLKESNRWKDIIYERHPQDSEALKETAAGKVLVKFDPDHHGKRKTTMWVEGTIEPHHDDEW